MAIAKRLKWYLDQHGAAYEVIAHPHSGSSRETARLAHVAEDQLAKCVLLEDERGYLLAVLPSASRIDLALLNGHLGRQLELATEAELAAIFEDCEPGAVPPVGKPYGIPTVVDEALLHVSEVYFEAGEHRDLVRMKGAEFAALMRAAPHWVFSRDAPVPLGEPLRGREVRLRRLDELHPHVFSLRAFGAGLRRQLAFEHDGHTGMILMKTPELRVVLELARAGTRLASHVVHGPSTLYVLAGALDVQTDDGTFRIGESEIAMLPRDEKREIEAAAESLFILSLSLGGSAPGPHERRDR
jgi:Ala-tRNA(Pro) deacylase